MSDAKYLNNIPLKGLCKTCLNRPLQEGQVRESGLHDCPHVDGRNECFEYKGGDKQYIKIKVNNARLYDVYKHLVNVLTQFSDCGITVNDNKIRDTGHVCVAPSDYSLRDTMVSIDIDSLYHTDEAQALHENLLHLSDKVDKLLKECETRHENDM